MGPFKYMEMRKNHISGYAFLSQLLKLTRSMHSSIEISQGGKISWFNAQYVEYNILSTLSTVSGIRVFRLMFLFLDIHKSVNIYIINT